MSLESSRGGVGSFSNFFLVDSSSPKSNARFDVLSVSALTLLPKPKPLTLPRALSGTAEEASECTVSVTINLTVLTGGHSLVEELCRAVGLLALLTPVVDVKVADALAISGTAMSFPSNEEPDNESAAFLAMALGSNFPA